MRTGGGYLLWRSEVTALECDLYAVHADGGMSKWTDVLVGFFCSSGS